MQAQLSLISILHVQILFLFSVICFSLVWSYLIAGHTKTLAIKVCGELKKVGKYWSRASEKRTLFIILDILKRMPRQYLSKCWHEEMIPRCWYRDVDALRCPGYVLSNVGLLEVSRPSWKSRWKLQKPASPIRLIAPHCRTLPKKQIGMFRYGNCCNYWPQIHLEEMKRRFFSSKELFKLKEIILYSINDFGRITNRRIDI